MSNLWPYDDNDPLNPPNNNQTLPKYPTVEGYKEVLGENRIVSDVEIGRAKVRRRFTSVPDSITERYILKKQQLEVLRNFFRGLNNGADRFIKPDPELGRDGEYRFVAPYTITPLSGDLYEVLMELERMPV